jgi:hypothetical protein
MEENRKWDMEGKEEKEKEMEGVTPVDAGEEGIPVELFTAYPVPGEDFLDLALNRS